MSYNVYVLEIGINLATAKCFIIFDIYNGSENMTSFDSNK